MGLREDDFPRGFLGYRWFLRLLVISVYIWLIPVLDAATANLGGGGPHHLTVVTGLVVELEAGDAGGGELINLIVPRVDGFPPVWSLVPGAEWLIQILTNFEPFHSSTLCTVVSEIFWEITTN